MRGPANVLFLFDIKIILQLDLVLFQFPFVLFKGYSPSVMFTMTFFIFFSVIFICLDHRGLHTMLILLAFLKGSSREIFITK